MAIVPFCFVEQTGVWRRDCKLPRMNKLPAIGNRHTQHQSTLSFSRPGLSFRVEVSTHYSKRHRRQILLILYRAVKPILSCIQSSSFHHSDSSLWEAVREMSRPVSLHQSLGLGTGPKSFGFEARMIRLGYRQTQAQLAKLSGISRPRISLIEHGQTTIRPATRLRIEEAFRKLELRYQSEQLPKRNREGKRGGRSGGERVWIETSAGVPKGRPGGPNYQGSSSPSKS